jgi:hypothetical protein
MIIVSGIAVEDYCVGDYNDETIMVMMMTMMMMPLAGGGQWLEDDRRAVRWDLAALPLSRPRHPLLPQVR